MLLYATVRRLLCLTLMALSLSCQAFVTSSRFPLGRALLRGGATTPNNSNEDSSNSNSNNNRARLGPLGVLRAPPTTTRRSRNDEEEGGEQRASSSASNVNKSKSKNNATPPRRNGNVVRTKLYAPSPLAAAKNGEASASSAAAAGAAALRSKKAEYVAETKLPTDVGAFQLRGYRVPGAPLGQEPCVIYCRAKPPFGRDGAPARGVPVRIHDQCLTSEVFRSQRCDCKEQLNMALRYIQKHGGFIVYLQQEGRGIGLANKIAAYALQDVGFDTVDANLHLGFAEDCREYGVVKSIMEDMKIESIQLMTNNPRKVQMLTQLGILVDRTLPMVVPAANQYNFKYLETKEKRMNHANLATLLAQDPQALEKQIQQQQATNGAMAPLLDMPHLANEYINNGTEMSANAVQVSLMMEDEEPEAEGVEANEDGYCFGRQSVEDAIAAIGRGEMVVVVDDLSRENEGDFIMAADLCTDLDMARIVRYSSGVVCIALEEDRLKELELPPMVTNNQDPKGTAFTVTVDATKDHGITTGISASDRAATVQLLAKSGSKATDFHRPGHIFPLRARPGGVLERDGHTEAAVDFSRLAGRAPAGVLCEIVSEENPTEMMRLPEIKRFCQRHGFMLTSIADLQQYRRDTEGGRPAAE